MRINRTLVPALIISFVLGVGADLWAESQDVGNNAVLFAETDTTGVYRAVFAQYLAVQPSQNPATKVECAISVSNVCAAPDAVSQVYLGNRALAGPVTVFLYARDGTLTTFTTSEYPTVGTGLDAQGRLNPGQTWTVLLAEILGAKWAVAPDQVEFFGYGWFLAHFDCVAGTYNNTVFGLGFTQAFELLPAMGQGGFLGGLMVPTP
jgi:hypothetical protein